MDQNKNCICSNMVHTVPSSHAPWTIKCRSGIAMIKDIVTCPKPAHLISEMQSVDNNALPVQAPEEM